MNEFDKLMNDLTKQDVVAYIRNCDVGVVGNIPATFSYSYSAALQWLKGQHMSRREITYGDGNTPTEALQNAIEKMNKEKS